MKILWLSHLIPYPPKGGVLQRSYNLVREISKYHDITLVAFVQNDLLKTMFSSVDAGIEESIKHLSQFCKYVEYVEIPSESVNYGKYKLAVKSLFTTDPYTINWLKSDLMFKAIRKIKETSDFDLVHFDTISLAHYLNEFDQVKKTLDHHNIESHMMLRRAEMETNPIKRFYYKLEGKKLLAYEKKHCPKFDIHITCSALDSQRLNEIDGSLNVTEIQNGVDIDYFYPNKENEKPFHLIFAGSQGWYPNRDAMFYFSREIWPLLKARVPQCVMNVVGSSPAEELLELGRMDHQFSVHGFVDDVRDYISSASVYVCPIRDGGGTKLKILDSFAMGMATVAHPMACEGLDAIDGENVLLASEPVEFVEKISLLLNDPALRAKLGKNARKTAVEKYSFISIGENLSKEYLNLDKRS